MRRTRVIIGIALMLGGPSAAVLALRSAVGDQSRAEAAQLADTTRASDARVKMQTKPVETEATAAAAIEPLRAGLRARVDGATLLDMFENEDWWRPYRSGFPITHVIVDGASLVARGPNPAAGAELVSKARVAGVASAIVTIDGKTFAAAAARIGGVEDREAYVLLARPVALEIPVAAPPPPAVATLPPLLHDKRVTWGIAGALCLGGLALIVSGRQRSGPGSVPQQITHEETFKFGTPSRPRAGVDPGLAAGGRGPITDGHAVSIPTGPARLTPIAHVRRPTGAGSPFGRYRLVDRLGEGGMSELFVAEAAGVEGFSRSFVLKRLRKELAHNKEAVAQFIDEARMQASLVHSNVVPVFDFGVVNNEYFMTQEYIVGRDLGRFVARHVQHTGAGLPEPVAYYIAHETALALAYAHDKRDNSGSPMGIIHRDVSAGNVMVSLSGEVKLSDFGIVKSNRRVSQTQVGMVKGNANFMSPEQARGLAVDPRSDIFSLAHVLHYCLTGHLLYMGDNDLDVLYRAATGLTHDDFAAIDRLPEPARGVLGRALAFDPAERFQSAAELADALAVHTGGGKAATARLIRELFGDELQRQIAGTAAVGAG